MPAKSQAQRAYLFWRFGPAWIKRHDFNNKGKLPARVSTARSTAVKRLKGTV